jgi:hypothetical protein
MKTPDHDYELHLGSAAKPDIHRKLFEDENWARAGVGGC